MKFLREVVEVSNENDSVDAKKNIAKILTEIKRYQSKTRSFIDANYVDFLPNLSTNELYLEDGEKLVREVENLMEIVENDTKNDLNVAVDELQQYVEELREAALGLRVSYKILKIDELFQSLESAKSNNEYLEAMNIADKIKSLITDVSDKIFTGLDCYQNVKIKYQVESEMLMHKLRLCFEELVQMLEKSFQNTKAVNVKISKNSSHLHQTIVALFNAKYNPKQLCDFLLENVFQPIITKPVSVELKDDDEDFVQLNLSYSIKDLAEDLRPNYKTVFKSIKTVMTCLSYINVQISDTLCVFNIFGEKLKEQFLNLLIGECLLYAIPDTMDEMNDSTLVEDIIDFNEYLVRLPFLKVDQDRDLIKYAEKIGLLFQNRFCTNILDNAIDIMHKDLHDMILVAESNTSTETAKNPSLFPRCMISKSTLEIINLMEKVIRQTSTVDDEISQRLLSTIPIILNRYLTEVPMYHEKLLHNIPQQTALFHNNCMYLAYWLTKYASKGIDPSENTTKNLQNMGTEYFVNQFKNQRTQLMEILQGFDLSDGVSELGIGPQKAIRQCLRQLDLLKNVWQTILPNAVYTKTMSNLLNDLCSEIIRRILSMEDISSAIANELVEICSIMIERAPTIFKDPLQINVNVKTWTKLTQLKMVLGASLAEITDQWSEGKGPLTLNFKAEEIKHLIRALFQNTDRRAKALASII